MGVLGISRGVFGNSRGVFGNSRGVFDDTRRVIFGPGLGPLFFRDQSENAVVLFEQKL